MDLNIPVVEQLSTIGGFCRQLIGNFKVLRFFFILFSFVGNVGDIYVDVGSLKMNKDNEAGEFKPGIGMKGTVPSHRFYRNVSLQEFFFRGTIRVCPGLMRAIIFETSP